MYIANFIFLYTLFFNSIDSSSLLSSYSLLETAIFFLITLSIFNYTYFDSSFVHLSRFFNEGLNFIFNEIS